jgi:anti-sigma factor RsiW
MCDDNNIPELLPEYLARTLDPGDTIRVEQHLASCEDCRTELALLSVIADDPVPVPDETFWAGMPDRIYREVQAREQRGKKRFAPSDILGSMFMPRLAWATAAVIVVAAVSWFMVRSAPLDVARSTQPATTGAAIEDSAADPVNVAELSSEEFDAASQWAQNEFAPIEKAITSDTQEHTSRELSEELSELSARELDRVYEMLKQKELDAQKKLRKKPGSEKRLG